MRRVTAVLVTGALVLTACSRPKSALDTVVDAAAKTRAGGSAHFSQRQPGRITTGTIDLEGHRVAMRTVLGGVAVDSVIDGRTVYVRVPSLAGQLGGKPWVRAAASDLPAAARLHGLASLIALVPSIEPTSTIAQLARTKTAVKVGKETVQRSDTTRYRAIIGDKRATVDVWVDDHGRAARIRDNTDAAATTELWDYGTAVQVHPPRATDTAPLEDLLRKAP